MVKRLSLLVIFAVIVVGAAIYSLRSNAPKVPVTPSAHPAPVKTPAPSVSTRQTQEVVAPNMEATLTMEEQRTQNMVTHTFLTSTKDGTPQKVFSKTLDSTKTLSIPFNTWSPDNTYFYLKESGTEGTSHIVLASSGKPVFKDEQTIAVENLFAKKYQNYTITDVTGWAGPTLLVVNTNKVDGTIGPSLWLDLSSLSFIQLATRFN